MVGKGRARDNVYIERFWRSLKQEKICLNPPNGGIDLHQIIKEYVYFYNYERRHKDIGRKPPNLLHYQTKLVSQYYYEIKKVVLKMGRQCIRMVILGQLELQLLESQN
jgi:hypothetical protein